MPGTPDPLAALDFDVICSLIHDGRPCTRKAGYVATVHQCGDQEGSRRPVCAYGITAIRAVMYPAPCRGCGVFFSDPSNYLWAIEPL